VRPRITLLLAATAALVVPAGALANLRHVVSAGESLSSVASSHHLSEPALAAANHLSPRALLIIGAVITIPVRDSDGDHDGSRPVAASTRYTVRPGDTLSGLAARARVSVARLAALNGLPPTSLLIAGHTIRLPGASGSVATHRSSARSSHVYLVRPGDTLSAIAARAGVSAASLAALNRIHVASVLLAGATLRVPGVAAAVRATPLRTYTIQLGDTLSGIAAHAGLSVSRLAALNGIHERSLLLAGASLKVPGSPSSSGGPPYPTAERVSAAQVEAIAVANDVPPSLAAAVGWQESGFNNDLVSSADARGVMQILPGTWTWIQQTLTDGTPLAPASALDNVRGGVLFLRSLLTATSDNPALAAAGYIQGLASVRNRGMYAVTRQYVKSVLALREQFGGP
jgi:N-acetylmuramoyl-L-alanine amidase